MKPKKEFITLSEKDKKELLARKDSFLIIKTSYSEKMVLPYDDGIKFLSYLKHAETYITHYDKLDEISSFDNENYTTEILSQADYLHIKMSTLLAINTKMEE